ncbi:SusC/RagA family TonB-linked outer membrane protein [Tenacibaculum sp. UWU-22]|uniref:SusC/RagA family TonB-linked outer membrane protein n=1 Tax=Tenacibaculum sp. UWU-22 TaxID=3234187 RepID=UPI0034DAFB64
MKKNGNFLRLLLLQLFLVLVVQVSFAQQKAISGIISDKEGPLPGVSVVIKGTSTGVATDFDGKYSIKAKPGDVLQFSYVGYTTKEKKVGNSNTINVTMSEDDTVLNEIVVTALGIKREKQSIGFAQQTVNAENLVRSRETDISNALAGKVAGVQFQGAPSSGFGDSSIRLRGDDNVLYIVDNVKVTSTSDINTDNIQDISVLKGAAATALYGPEGINGVVIITSKGAKKGEAVITLNHSTSIEKLGLLPEYQNEYGGGGSQEFDIFKYDSSKDPASWAAFDGQKMIHYATDESWGPKMDGQMVRHWDSWIPGGPEFGKLRAFVPHPENIRSFYDVGTKNNTSVSFTKGGDDYSVRATIGNIDRTLISPNSHRKTINMSINTSINLNDKLRAYTIVNYQNRKTKNAPDTGSKNLSGNFNQWFQRQLDFDRLRNYKFNGKKYSWNLASARDLSAKYWDSPFFEPYENLKFGTKDAMYGKVGLEYTLNDAISASLEVRKNFSAKETNDRQGFGGEKKAEYSEKNSYKTTNELFGIVNYDKNLSEDLDLKANAGFELSSYHSQSLKASTEGGLSTENFFSLNTSIDRPSVSNDETNSKTKSVFAKASLGYKKMLYLDGTARLDWSSTADPTANRVGTYGGSASFIFSRLLSNNDILSFGKLRVSLAQAPKFPSTYALLETYDIGTPYGAYGTLSVNSTYANPHLKGGVREEFEVGTELKLYGNRLGLDVTYFNKKDKELPSKISLAPATGYDETYSNEGRQTYKGIEVGLSATPIKTNKFSWDTYLNYATLNRTVDFIADGVARNIISSNKGIHREERPGEEWGALYGAAYKRNADGKLVLSSKGLPKYESDQYLGSSLPDFTGGFINNFKYKNFSLGFDIDFQFGGKIFSRSNRYNNSSGIGIETVGNNNLGNPVRNAISGGSSSKYVNASDANSDTGGVYVEGVDDSGNDVAYYVDAKTYWKGVAKITEQWLYGADYVKLRTIRFDYTFDKDIIKHTPFSDINIGLIANNVWLIHSEIPGFDPSELESTWAESGQTPNVRTFGINLKLTF